MAWIVPVVQAISAAYGAYATAQASKEQTKAAKELQEQQQPLPALPELPQPTIEAPTKAEDIIKQSEEEARKEEIQRRIRRTDRSKTILTSTQGVLGEAPTVRK